MKKLTALILTLIIVLSMGMGVLAAESSISVNPTDTHTYDIYQIFKGEVNGKEFTGSLEWGRNGVGQEGELVTQDFLDELMDVNSLDDKAQLVKIEEFVNFSSTPYGKVSAGASLVAPTGYYLFVDKGVANGNGGFVVPDNDSKSLFVVQVVGPTTISPKKGEVTSEKKVKDKNDTDGTVTDWQDSADYDIGDEIPFLLKGTVAGDYANYESYYYAFHDQLEDTLDFDSDSVVVKVDGTQITSGYTILDADHTDGCTFEVEFTNLKAIPEVKAGSVITVEYTAVLKENAHHGAIGNNNIMHVVYSNNPNAGGSGEKGETKDDKVVVFTYKVVVNKTDEHNNALPGAGFTLYKKNPAGTYDQVGDEIKGDAMTQFVWLGLDDGDYKLSETTTPDGYNKIKDIEFTITADHAVLSDNPNLISLDGGDLEAGHAATGAIQTTVVNKSGATLPETGGIGTKIFYVLGAGLMIVAVVAWVTRRRMDK